MDDPTCVGEARRFVSNLAAQLDFEETRKGRLGIIVNELGNNLVRYAPHGKILARHFDDHGCRGIDILSLDKGPGLDVGLVMRDGYSSGSTPGEGLGAVQRLSHDFDILSTPSTGTAVFSRVYANEAAEQKELAFEVGAVNVPIHSEAVSGDDWAYRQVDDQFDMVMIDGLGHGPAANKASSEGVEAFEMSLPTTPDVMLQLIHNRLRSTRGGAAFVVRVKSDIVDYTGAGNIRAIIMSPEKTSNLLSQNGTAGVQIRTARLTTQTWNGSGYLILHSDGITGSWDLAAYPGIFRSHPALVAGIIYRDFCRGTDDATVAVMRKLK